MFLPTDQNAYKGLPANCTFEEGDWHILASFWHPVAFSTDVGDKPIRVKLLDMDVVVYRTVDGISAARDICIHRGAALSLGWLDEDRKNLVCPFHGLHYDHTGRCTKIPSLPDQSQKIPSNLCLDSYQAVERYGLVWVCMKEEATRPIPEWPLLENGGDEWSTFSMPEGHWNTSAARHVENFNDVAHFSWVHVRTFGNRNQPEIPNYELKRTETGLWIRLPYPEVTGLRKGDGTDGEDVVRDVFYTKDLTYPFATDLILEFTREDGVQELTHIYDVATPKSARETAIFQLIQTNVPGAKAEDFQHYQGVVNSEDVPIVESQKPEELPLNIASEIHIPADKMSIQYRKDLINVFGLGAPSMTG